MRRKEINRVLTLYIDNIDGKIRKADLEHLMIIHIQPIHVEMTYEKAKELYDLIGEQLNEEKKKSVAFQIYGKMH